LKQKKSKKNFSRKDFNLIVKALREKKNPQVSFLNLTKHETVRVNQTVYKNQKGG